MHKSSRTFNSSHKLSTELPYTQIIKNIQLFSEMINTTIIYTNRINHSTLLRNCQQNNHIHKLSKTFNSYLKLSTELSYTQFIKNIQLFPEIINTTIINTNRQEHSTPLRNYLQNYHIHNSSRTFKSSQQ
jgi:hypothetical protein